MRARCAESGGSSAVERDDDDGLQRQPSHGAEQFKIGYDADDRHGDGCRQDDGELPGRVLEFGKEIGRAGAHGGRCGDHADAAALRRRLAMRGARVGPGQRVTHEQRPQSRNERGAAKGGGHEDERQSFRDGPGVNTCRSWCRRHRKVDRSAGALSFRRSRLVLVCRPTFKATGRPAAGAAQPAICCAGQLIFIIYISNG